LLKIECYGVARIRIFQRNHLGEYKLRCNWILSAADQFNWDLVNLEIRKKYGGTVVDAPAEVRMEVWWIPAAGGSGVNGGIPDQAFEMFVGSSQTIALVAPQAGLVSAPSAEEDGGADEFGDFDLDFDPRTYAERMRGGAVKGESSGRAGPDMVFEPADDEIATDFETTDDEPPANGDQEQKPIPWGLIVAGLALGAFLSK